jgi:hypothetical protein
MKSVLHAWQILLVILAGWINKHQQNAIEYLITEDRILREKLDKRRILLTDDQRRRLAIKGKILGRKTLAEICTIVTPETILRWHRTRIADKWNYSKCRKKVGRPNTDKEMVDLLVQMARENPAWGYRVLGLRGIYRLTVRGNTRMPIFRRSSAAMRSSPQVVFSSRPDPRQFSPQYWSTPTTIESLFDRTAGARGF